MNSIKTYKDIENIINSLNREYSNKYLKLGIEFWCTSSYVTDNTDTIPDLNDCDYHVLIIEKEPKPYQILFKDSNKDINKLIEHTNWYLDNCYLNK